jgi:hypothetical protein
MANDPRPIEQHLADAQQRIDEGLKQICHQKGVVADLECGQQQGAGLERQRSNLKTLMDAQVLLVEKRDRLLAVRREAEEDWGR